MRVYIKKKKKAAKCVYTWGGASVDTLINMIFALPSIVVVAAQLSPFVS